MEPIPDIARPRTPSVSCRSARITDQTPPPAAGEAVFPEALFAADAVPAGDERALSVAAALSEQVLSRKPGALPGSSALAQARSGGGFTAAHERFWQRARRRLGDGAGTRALVEVLLLHRHLPAAAVHAALDAVERLGALDPALVAIEARRIADGRRESAVVERPALRRFERPAPSLAGYDALLAGSTR